MTRIGANYWVGKINTHLHKFELSLSLSREQHTPLADSTMTFMVRGLFNQLNSPISSSLATGLLDVI